MNKGKYLKEITDFINLSDIQINTKEVIPPYKLDIYIPEYKLAIEFDCLEDHSSGKLEDDRNIKKIHLNPTNLCRSKDIQLLHIFENEWTDPRKQEVWKSIISSKLNRNNKIYARECVVKELNGPEYKEFLNKNHLQGAVPSSVKLGLYYKDELVSVMALSKPRFNRRYDWELTRFCSKLYYNISGGPTKMFAYFIGKYQPKSMICYSDLRYSFGNLYNKMNFKYLGSSGPNYYYFRPPDTQLSSRIKFQKHKLPQVLEVCDPGLGEVPNMYNNNYRRIWDCGNMVFEYRA